MALKSPLMPSPTGPGFMSHFSPYTDSPSSPAPYNSSFPPASNRNSNPSDSLHPPVSPYPNHADPSPVESNGSANTEIDEDAQEETDPADLKAEEMKDGQASSEEQALSPASQEALAKLDTALSPEARAEPEDGPTSVIHIPSGFKNFESKQSPPRESHAEHAEHSPTRTERTDHTERTEDTVLAATPSDEHTPHDEKRGSITSPLNTSIPNPKTLDQGTPRAQTRQELEEEWKRRSRAHSNLEGIQEEHDSEKHDVEIQSASGTTDQDTMQRAMENLNNAEEEIAALKTALSECWTLCNTLAGLSSMHRERIFQFEGKGGAQEQAWRSCWRLCKKLYETREEDHATQVRPTLELCRDFCQALFEVRTRGDDVADSVLRVSFELNNHLYNTQDRNLPEAFRERTLDFYLTLCHRLMKQRTSLPQETDSLLRACWSLAEMLFSLRQNNRDGKPVDEELLGSAVQACWDLGDLFREGWTQIRPERGTPKPIYSFNTAAAPQPQLQPPIRPEGGRASSLDDQSYHSIRSYPPETPITIFDDITAASSPAEDAPVPNILVLGPEQSSNHARGSTSHNRWDSSASAYSDASSAHTGSTATTGRDPIAGGTSNDSTLIRLKCLILKAAINVGFTRPPSSAASTSSTSSSNRDSSNDTQTSLPSFVSSLPPNAFGALPWQHTLLKHYKTLVTSDPTLRDSRDLPTGRRVSAGELARAVNAMVRTGQFEWLRELYRLVFGFGIDEVGGRAGVVVST